MKEFIQRLRSHPARFYLAVFLSLIVPAVLLYPLAESGGQGGMMFFLILIILSNTAVLFY